MKALNYIVLLLILTCVSACEMNDFEQNTGGGIQEESNLLILCEGLVNMNNSTLCRYDAKTKTLSNKFFVSANSRGLGDTANDMKKYGSKTYILVNMSSQVEVINHNTGKSIRQIPLFDYTAGTIARQPRSIVFHENKAYVTCFDGNVVRIDTATLEIDGIVKCGRNPEGVCVANDKLYVANSGGLDYPYYDNRISVVDIATFTHLKFIEVFANPVNIASDSEGDVYVISNGNYDTDAYVFSRIDSELDEVAEVFEEINPLNITIYDDKAYMYSYDYTSDTQWFKVFDCISEKVVNDNFITDGTEISKPFGIDINPANEDIIICEAYQYVTWGDVLCFDKDGKLKYRIKEVGLNPNTVTFN